MRRERVLAATAIALIALSACGSPGDTEADGAARVATLTSAAPSAPAPAKAKVERPRERLDTTPDEYEALLVPYHKCLRENGARGKGDGKGRDMTPAEAEKFEAANRICEPQFMPLPPWEKDPANPEARDFAVAVVKCLKQKGVKYVEVSDDGISLALGGDQNDPRSISRGMDLAPECERKVAAAMK